ncbi:hypothetical protein QWY28_17250 [Nocardioides sp. SOB77]|uniref:Uncharacterized protein n=1 Tax=Nocardioides oceani TaxID=3058369 RepID=A0ABT8FJ60_9ACTN|nr:hypothetical protein [Nocardioides oceani]MDN4174711.1 hypothetical protein [Nocardioides oceani]
MSSEHPAHIRVEPGQAVMAAPFWIGDRTNLTIPKLTTIRAVISGRLMTDAGRGIRSDVWFTEHFGRSAHDRFHELGRDGYGIHPVGCAVLAAGGPRALLLVGWCVVDPATIRKGHVR